MIILSSASPRRHDILYEFGYMHKVVPSHVDEISTYKKEPKEVCETNSYLKANDIYKDYPNETIIGADTIVVINNKILGKPKDKEEAIHMLQELSDNTHEVITGVTVINKDNKITFSVTSYVTFKKLSLDDINYYIENDNVYDKAGSYAIQNPILQKYIKEIKGSYYNIVGLPIEKLMEVLDNLD